MKSLTEVVDIMSSKDAELEKQAAEMIKQAEEEDAAGRIMARGFAAELSKLADANMGAGYNPLAGGRGGRQKVPAVPKATDTNAPGQAFNAGKTKMNPVTGQHQNPGQPKPAAAPKAKITLGAGPLPPKPAGT